MDEVTAYIKSTLEAMGLWEQMNLILLSDHGMAQVNQSNLIPLGQFVDMSFVKLTSTSDPVLLI